MRGGITQVVHGALRHFVYPVGKFCTVEVWHFETRVSVTTLDDHRRKTLSQIFVSSVDLEAEEVTQTESAPGKIPVKPRTYRTTPGIPWGHIRLQ